MNALQKFISSKPYGFLRDADLPELIRLDRLCQVLVRCGGCRFTCSAQDVEHLEACIKAGGDYVRDVSFPVGAMERAASYVPEQFRSEHPTPELTRVDRPMPAASIKPALYRNAEGSIGFDESDCSGAFDGNQVTSDADSGL